MREERILCNLDRLKHLIKNTKEKGQETISLQYENYYNEVRNRPRIKELIMGTIHEVK